MHSLTINPHKTIKDISCHFNLMVSPFLHQQDKKTNISYDIEISLNIINTEVNSTRSWNVVMTTTSITMTKLKIC